MATVKVERPPIESITLNLTEREAVFIAQSVGAKEATSLSRGIYNALERAGLGYGHADYGTLR